MKIAEVIGSVADQDQEGVAPVCDLMGHIANQFTRTGQVKRPLDIERLNTQSATTLSPSSSISIPGEEIFVAAEPVPFQNPAVPLQRSTHGLTRRAAGTRGLSWGSSN